MLTILKHKPQISRHHKRNHHCEKEKYVGLFKHEIVELQINRYVFLNSCTKEPMAPKRQPATATVPTTRTPAVTPNENTVRSIIPNNPRSRPVRPMQIKIMPVAIRKRHALIKIIVLTYQRILLLARHHAQPGCLSVACRQTVVFTPVGRFECPCHEFE